MEPIVNKVAQSEIEVFDLGALADEKPIVEFDLAAFLYQGLIVREKEFRDAVKDHDWASYTGSHIALFCSVDTIVPTWAYMLVAIRLEPFATSIGEGRREDLARQLFARKLAQTDLEKYRDRIVVVKGCGSSVVPVSAYVDVITRLQRVARKLMYGEPCSFVPLWRRPVEK